MKDVACLMLSMLMALFATSAWAEQGCPPGQIPAQSNGSMTSCGPIPPGYYQEQQAPAPRPSGKWIKTWGAVALGLKDSIPYYGVPVGIRTEKEAEKEALARCTKLGAENCRVVSTFTNQCMAIGEPQTDGKPDPNGYVQFSRQPGKQNAIDKALSDCVARNPKMQCKVIYAVCSEQIFQEF